jgi:hypothetical protein
MNAEQPTLRNDPLGNRSWKQPLDARNRERVNSRVLIDHVAVPQSPGNDVGIITVVRTARNGKMRGDQPARSPIQKSRWDAMVLT